MTTYYLVDMIIVGQVSNKQEALEIRAIAKLSIVAQRARYLARHRKAD